MKNFPTTEIPERIERIPFSSATGVHSDSESLDPLCQLPDVEVDQKTNRASRELEVGENLRLMDRKQFLHGLQLDDHGLFDQQVNPVTTIESHSFVSHWQFLLSFHPEPLLLQFVGSKCCIDKFESWINRSDYS